MPFPTPGDLPDQEINPASPALAGGFFTAEPPEKPSLKTSLGALYLFLSEVAQSCLTLAIPWTVACQALMSMGFPRLEY